MVPERERINVGVCNTLENKPKSLLPVLDFTDSALTRKLLCIHTRKCIEPSASCMHLSIGKRDRFTSYRTKEIKADIAAL